MFIWPSRLYYFRLMIRILLNTLSVSSLTLRNVFQFKPRYICNIFISITMLYHFLSISVLILYIKPYFYTFEAETSVYNCNTYLLLGSISFTYIQWLLTIILNILMLLALSSKWLCTYFLSHLRSRYHTVS